MPLGVGAALDDARSCLSAILPHPRRPGPTVHCLSA